MEWGLFEVTAATTCMNRLVFLKQAIKTWIVQPIARIVVLDWGSTIPIRYSDLPPDPRIVLYRTEWEGGWPGMALPHGASVRLVKTRMVLKIDCDICITGSLPTQCPKGRFWQGTRDLTKAKSMQDWEAFGTFLCPVSMFDAVNGYDERMRGWGGIDNDLYKRMEAAGFKGMFFPDGVLSVLRHDDSIRAKSQKERNVALHKTDPWGVGKELMRLDIREVPR